MKIVRRPREMPEGDTIYRAARALHKVLAGRLVRKFDTVLPKLGRIEVDTPITGRIIEKVEAQGKWQLMHFSGDLILLTHMLMRGSWHIYRPGETWKRRAVHMRIVVATDEFVAVGFNVPIAEFHTSASLQRHPRLNRLGPSVLAPEIDTATMISNLRSLGDWEVGAALLNQSAIAGVGNVFKSEVCYGAGVNPFRRVGALTIQEIASLVATARKFMLANITENSGDQIATLSGLRRTTGRASLEDRLWVYHRRDKPCHRCRTPIQSRKQNPDARTTFWCPQCQPMFRAPKVGQ